MKKFPYYVTIAALMMSAYACGSDDPEEPTPKPPTPEEPGVLPEPNIPVVPLAEEYATFDVRDMALIYQGGSHRIDWTVDEFIPYVVHENEDGDRTWLFDAYLFLEIYSGYDFQFAPGYKRPNARKAEWEWYLDRLFKKDQALDALDQAIGKGKEELGDPGFRHKVVLTILTPIDDQKDWGELDGRALDFSLMYDKKKAAMWFVDQLITRFKAAKFKNIDLLGFYWVAEAANESSLPPYLAEDIWKLGYKFVWIPYNGAQGASDWQKYGFNVAYQQPNYFFNTYIDYSRFKEVSDFAIKNHMAMEYECDERVLTDPAYRQRMKAYTDAFEQYGVYENSAIAYYLGSTLLLDAYNNFEPLAQREIDRMAKHIADRRSTPSLQTK